MTTSLRFGCQYGPFKGRETFLNTTRRLEAEGFSIATMPDHFGGWSSVWPSLVAAASVTTTLRVGPLTINNDMWNPLVLARDIVSVDHLTGGRLEVGIGAGWRAGDYEWTGIAHDAAGVRIRRLRESVELLRRYFQPGAFEHHGEFYDAAVPEQRMLPAQDGGVPLFIGGGGRNVLRLAAEQADIIGVHINLGAGTFTIGSGAANSDQGVVVDAMEERLGWISADRSPGRDAPLQLFFMEVREDPDPLTAAASIAPTFGVAPQAVVQSPWFLAGPVEAMADKIRAVNERYGISYFTCREDHVPVITRVIALLT